MTEEDFDVQPEAEVDDVDSEVEYEDENEEEAVSDDDVYEDGRVDWWGAPFAW